MMEEEDPDNSQKPGLHEAINPEIANHSTWESDPFHLTLRLPDPSKSIEELLFNEGEKANILARWNKPSIDPNSIPHLKEENPDPSETSLAKKKIRDKKITSPLPEKSTIPEWLDGIEDETFVKEDLNKPLDPEPVGDPLPSVEVEKEVSPEGKRVKKAVKKARKELEKASAKDAVILPRVSETNLSPFTSWLKSLKGSEYVHPYEDDYALLQQREGISETLADLLASQGYKDQAVDMYSQLMAKYPEKSSFFAAKIEALK